jgi:hypothetical protein
MKMREVGHVVRMRDYRNSYGVLVGKPEGNTRFGRPNLSCGIILNQNLNNIEWR